MGCDDHWSAGPEIYHPPRRESVLAALGDSRVLLEFYSGIGAEYIHATSVERDSANNFTVVGTTLDGRTLRFNIRYSRPGNHSYDIAHLLSDEQEKADKLAKLSELVDDEVLTELVTMLEHAKTNGFDLSFGTITAAIS